MEANVLERALELIEGGWTQKWYAEDKEGNGCSPHDESAVSFCLLGAITRAAGELGEEPTDSIVAVLKQFEKPAVIWNDTPGRTHGQVKEVLRRAIAEAELVRA